MGENLTTPSKSSVKKTVQESVQQLKPMIKEIPNRIVERADQVLLGLSHTKQSVPTLLKQALTRIEGNPADLVGRVSRSVLERADIIRKQLIEKAEEGSESILNQRWVPDWLIVRTAADAVGADAAVNAEALSTKEKAPAEKSTQPQSADSVAGPAAPVKTASKKSPAMKSAGKKTSKAKAGEQMPLTKVSAKAKKPSRAKKA